jgi:hypothetical protein
MSRFIRAGSTPRIAGDGDQKKHISDRVRFARNGLDVQEITDFAAISESEPEKLKKICPAGDTMGKRQLYDGFCLADSDDRRHDQSNGANSVSATAGCSLFWTTVHGSVPTDACVIRSIFRPQSQMPMEDAFCMMTPLLRGHYTPEAL